MACSFKFLSHSRLTKQKGTQSKRKQLNLSFVTTPLPDFAFHPEEFRGTHLG